MNLTVS